MEQVAIVTKVVGQVLTDAPFSMDIGKALNLLEKEHNCPILNDYPRLPQGECRICDLLLWIADYGIGKITETRRERYAANPPDPVSRE